MTQKETKKTNANCNQVILDHFWLISAPSDDRRCKSVQIILNTLKKQVANKQFNDLSYCLERLIRGLTSSREFARYGFCVLFTELLRQFPEEIELKNVLEIAEKEFGQFKTDSDSDHTIAWTLLTSCILKSERITTDIDEEIHLKLFEILYLLGCKKDYVEIIVCQTMNQFFDVFKENLTFFEKTIMKRITDVGDQVNQLFRTYLMLLAFQKYPSLFKNDLQKIYLKNSKDFTNVIKLIKESTKYSPNVHPINELLVETIEKLDPENLSVFYTKLIEEIFKTDMTKIALGFEIIPILLRYAKQSHIQIILSKNVIRIIIQTLSNKNHPLHSAAIKLNDYLIEYCANNKENSEIQVSFAKCFIENPGSINFDELYRSKLLSGILKTFNNESIKKWVNMLLDLMTNHDNVELTDYYRVRCLQQMTNLLKNYTDDDMKFLNGICKFLFIYAYFDVENCSDFLNDQDILPFKHPVSEKLRQQFVSSFKNIFAHLRSMPSIHKIDSLNRLKNQIKIYSVFKNDIINILKNQNLKLIDENLSVEALKEIFVELNEKFESLPSKSDDENKLNVFRLLYLHFMMESFENLEEINSILPDLNQCAERALSKSKKHSSSTDVMWSDVLVELFISSVSRSKHTKNIILMLFKHIVPFITADGIQSLNDALNNNESIEFMDTDDINNDESENEEDNEDDGDEEKDSDEDDDEEMIEDNLQVDQKFKDDISKALGSALDNHEDEDSDVLSDSEMFKLDDKLAEVFRQKFGKERQQNDKINLLKSFKLAVLDLISVVIEHHPKLSIGTVFMFLQNLINMVQTNNFSHRSTNPLVPVTNKCAQIIIQISKTQPVLEEGKKIDTGSFEELFGMLFEALHKCVPPQVQKSLITISKWLASLYRKHFPNSDIKFIHKHFEQALKDFLNLSNPNISIELFKSVLPSLLVNDSMNLDSFYQSSYYITLQECLNNEKTRAFRRFCALEILIETFNRLFHDGHTEESQNLKTMNELSNNIQKWIDVLPNNLRKKIPKSFLVKLKKSCESVK